MQKFATLVFTFITLAINTSAQLVFDYNDSVQVKINGNYIQNAWAGGINYGQFSAIDLNLDGTKDLVVFDRAGNKIMPFLNSGTTNQIDYKYAPQYISKFPSLTDWALFVDYNCDGKEDIFSYSFGGFSVFTNISSPSIGLFFRLEKYVVKSHYSASPTDFIGLYVSRVDIPALVDVDYDGDIDVLTFDINSGTEVEFHKNMSIENYGHCDSINDYRLQGTCWGNFAANTTNTVQLNVACRPAPKNSMLEPNTPLKTLHVGSTLLAFDKDNDHDYDLLMGGVSSNDLNLLSNGGDSVSAHITTQENNFPTANVPVNLSIFPAAFALDINNDSFKDLIVTPNAGNSAENFTSVLYYKNNSITGAYDLNFQTNAFLQDQMIETGEGAYPAFFDYNSDGLLDLIIGNYGYYNVGASLTCKLSLYKNIGNATQPEFELITRDYAGIAAFNLQNAFPVFGDVDGDGDKDMVIGTNSNAGSLLYFENLAGSGNTANFVLANTSLITGLGQFPAPQLVDVNRDGKLDLLIGLRNGTISYHESGSSIGNIQFSFISNNFGNVNVAPNGSSTGYCVPQLLDENGYYRLYAGNVDGHIYLYDNIDSNLSGAFTLKDSLYRNIQGGLRVAPTFADLNADGFRDAVLGNFSGGLTYYKGKPSLTSVGLTPIEKTKIYVFPNPAGNEINFKLTNVLPETEKKLLVTNAIGELVYEQKIYVNTFAVNSETWPNGVYTIKLIGKNDVVMQKFIVSK